MLQLYFISNVFVLFKFRLIYYANTNTYIYCYKNKYFVYFTIIMYVFNKYASF